MLIQPNRKVFYNRLAIFRAPFPPLDFFDDFAADQPVGGDHFGIDRGNDIPARLFKDRYNTPEQSGTPKLPVIFLHYEYIVPKQYV